MAKWSKEETEYLIENYSVLTASQLALVLKRTKGSIEGKVRTLDIGLTEEQRKKRISMVFYNKHALGEFNGDKNPSWKGGISKDAYHYKKLQKERYPERVKARNTIYYLVRSGKLKKQPCIICGASKVEAHHPDYNYPKEVIWYCKKHHQELHRNFRKDVK